jgi:hypothetical protein
MLITIVILVAAVIAAVAYFAARIFPARESRDEGGHRAGSGACPDVAPGVASYVHAMSSKEES